MDIEYEKIFENAFVEIKAIRDPHANDLIQDELLWDKVIEHSIFKFDKSFAEYNTLIEKIKNITIKYLSRIISLLNIKYNCDFMPFYLEHNEKIGFLENVIYAINDRKNKEILFIKEVEENSIWKKPYEDDEIQSIITKHECRSCKYIYLMDDCAYLQLVYHNENENDPGRGNNCFGIKYLFDRYFINEDYNLFQNGLNDYVKKINDYIGYSCVRNLKSNSLIYFKYLAYNNLQSYDYSKLVNDKILTKDGPNKDKINILEKMDYEIIYNNFKNDTIRKIFMSGIDFVESFITSEWLSISLTNCCAIDLTSIVSGYLKSGEQLLYSIVCLHKNKNRKIKRIANKTIKKRIDILSDDTVEEKCLGFSLGSMAYFFAHNKDIFDNGIAKSYDYICEKIFEYTDLRNGFFHKDNIHKDDKDENGILIIEKIRNKTYELFFLILGSINLKTNDLIKLKIPSMEYYDDYYRLCEFVNYHSNAYYFICNDDKEDVFISLPDNYQEFKDSHIVYSGMYFFKNVNGKKCIIRITSENMPACIYYGKLFVEKSDKPKFYPKKICKIFENGKYVGPNIYEDKNFEF